MEQVAKEKLISLLPGDFKEDYYKIFFPQKNEELRLIKAADKIAAYLKCLEETNAGNGEFKKARESIKREINSFTDLPEAAYFMEEFAASFSLTLDEMD